jgi:hypothetical protein
MAKESATDKQDITRLLVTASNDHELRDLQVLIDSYRRDY